MSEPQRIVMLFESFGVGGAEIAALALLEELRNRGHSCDAVALWEPDDLAPRLDAAGVPPHQLGLSHRWRTDQAVRRLTAKVRELRPTVLHAQLFFAGFYSALTRPLASGPVRVVTFQNLGYESYPADTPWLRVRKRMDGAAMKRGIDAHIAVSSASAAHYRDHISVVSDAVIPNGVEAKAIAAARPPDREALSALAPVEGQLIVCPARFVHEKGHRFLLDAVSQLREKGVAPTVLLAGDGPLRTEIEAQVSSLGLDSQVHLLGSVPHSDLLDLMRVSDVVVMPSTHEGFPVAAAEAGAAGAATVASSVGGLPDLIEDRRSGRLVPPGDSAALANALGEILDDEEVRVAYGSGARARVLATCDIAQVASRHEELYEELRRRRGEGSR